MAKNYQRLLGNFKYDNVEFECFGYVEPADKSVGYNGSVELWEVYIGDVNVTEVLKDSAIEGLEGEIAWELL